MGTKVENILYIKYFINPRVVGKHGRKDIRGCWKGPDFIFLMQQGAPKRTSLMIEILIFQ